MRSLTALVWLLSIESIARADEAPNARDIDAVRPRFGSVVGAGPLFGQSYSGTPLHGFAVAADVEAGAQFNHLVGTGTVTAPEVELKFGIYPIAASKRTHPHLEIIISVDTHLYFASSSYGAGPVVFPILAIGFQLR